MAQSSGIYVSELTTTHHTFSRHHFCRGNSSKRKSRLGLILKGSGTYLYHNKRLTVTAGDAVFIPENVYCYSEWRGDPEIEVLYLSCFMHYESYTYEPQLLPISEEEKHSIVQISELLAADPQTNFEAYSRFYALLGTLIPKMQVCEETYDKTLQTAMAYITDRSERDISVGELARECCVSESTLYHLFRRELGQTPIAFLHSVRINIAIEYLENSSYSVATVSRLVGFHSENHFRKVFSKLTGTTPLKYRKGR